MQVQFRQGIIRAVPNFLQLTGGTVSLVIPYPSYVLITLADGDSNYVVSERASVPNAWAGPFQPGTNYWLYWDIHPLTGAKTYGQTLYAPIEAPRAPVAPWGDQHWFDTSTNTMKVWNAAIGRWVRKIRVFAALLSGVSVFVSTSISSPSFEGTQVGSFLNAAVTVGFLVFDNEGKALRRNNGTFFTTEDVAITGVSTTSQVKFGSIIREAEAMSNMTRNTVVMFTDFDKISPAEPHMVTQAKQFGIIEEDVVIGSFVNIVSEGAVTSDSWDWTPYGVNAPLYVGVGGVLATEPSPLALTPIALVTGKHSIHFGVPRVVNTIIGGSINGVMTETTLGTGKLSLASATPDDPVVVGDNDPRLTDARIPLPHDHDSVYVNTTGDIMTGLLTLSGNPVDAMNAATKQYVDISITQPQIATFVVTNELVVNPIGTIGWFPPKDGQILSVTAMVSSSPTGSDVVLGVRKNGTSILGSQVLSISDGSKQGVSVTLTVPVNVTTTDFITVDTIQVGATTPGSDLTVRVTYK